MVRGRGVNPSYRTIQAALENGATFRSVGDTSATIDADSVAFSDGEVHEQMGTSWSIDTQRYGDASLRIGVLRTKANIRTSSTPIYSFIPAGSINARMRTKSRIRTGA